MVYNVNMLFLFFNNPFVCVESVKEENEERVNVQPGTSNTQPIDMRHNEQLMAGQGAYYLLHVVIHELTKLVYNYSNINPTIKSCKSER